MKNNMPTLRGGRLLRLQLASDAFELILAARGWNTNFIIFHTPQYSKIIFNTYSLHLVRAHI